jgi:hypothetical protein
VLFLITFATTKERIKPVNREKILAETGLCRQFVEKQSVEGHVSHDAGSFLPFSRFAAARSTIIIIITPTRQAMFDFVQKLGLVAPAGLRPASGGILETLGYIVHGDRSDWPNPMLPTWQQPHQYARHWRHHRRHFALGPRWRENLARKPSRSPVRAWRPWHPGILRAFGHQCRLGMVALTASSPSLTRRPFR